MSRNPIKAGEPTRKTAESPVRIEADVAQLARMVATFEKRTIGEVISEILREPLTKRYQNHLQKAHAELKRKE